MNENIEELSGVTEEYQAQRNLEEWNEEVDGDWYDVDDVTEKYVTDTLHILRKLQELSDKLEEVDEHCQEGKQTWEQMRAN